MADAIGLPEKTEEAVKQALAGVTPEQMLAVKQADQQFAAKMQELGFQNQQALEAIAAGDRASAREREVKTGDITPRLLAAVVVAGFFAIMALMIFQELPPTGRDSLLVLVGALGAAFGSIIQYYYGSSAGSAEKARTIDAMKRSGAGLQ
ncbi:hypothetical protein BI347_19000 [Chromobacterium sphagni]|uniref:Uncharacterized protein n=1 Tax=Chromobacterium sphagni TaxID=1903179 RepID=A0A1S1WTB0_9NEIS|nr:hypothetical protein BI347_22335 [Chromobacterium sphagni]OHX10619.1 hypothetical protein BI347_19000 [Chromobacterium sphagni]